MDFLADQHTHSAASPDSGETVKALCESAVSKGLSALAVTDHCEANGYRAEGYDRSILVSGTETQAAREQFAGRLEVLRGLELGQATQDIASAEEALAARSYDLVLASMHNLPATPDFYYINMIENDPQPLFERYLDELLGLVHWGNFDVLAHLTYPLRYMEGVYHRRVNIARCAQRLDAILSGLAQSGKGLEINTSGFRQGLGTAMPGLEQIKRFRELGGEILTFGSDAHRASDVGANIRDGMELARVAGFRAYAVYRNHQPSFYPL